MRKNKIKIAIESMLDSLIHMFVALLTALLGRYAADNFSWKAALCLVFSVVICMAILTYFSRTESCGFFESDEKED